MSINWSDSAIVVGLATIVGTTAGIVIQRVIDAVAARVEYRRTLARDFLKLRFEASQRAARVLIAAADELQNVLHTLDSALAGQLDEHRETTSPEGLTRLAKDFNAARADLHLLLDEESLQLLDRLPRVGLARVISTAQQMLPLLPSLASTQKILAGTLPVTPDAETERPKLRESYESLSMGVIGLRKEFDGLQRTIRDILHHMRKMFSAYE